MVIDKVRKIGESLILFGPRCYEAPSEPNAPLTLSTADEAELMKKRISL